MPEITLHMLRLLVNERLSAASEEIYGIIEKTMTEHHAEVSRLNKEIDYHRKLLDTVLKPEIKLYRTDHQNLTSVIVAEEIVLPEQQVCEFERSASMMKEESEPLQIKEEQEELWTSQRVEHHGLEADPKEFSLAQTCMKTNHSGDQTQFSDLTRRVESTEGNFLPPTKTKQTKKETKQTKMEPDSREQVKPRTKKDSWPISEVNPVCSGAQRRKTGHIDGRERVEHQSGLKIQKTPERQAVTKQCSRVLSNPKSHSQSHAAPDSCKACGRHFHSKGSLIRHQYIHAKGKDCSFGVCGQPSEVINHTSAGLNSPTRTHIREKPYCCHVCGKDFCSSGNLNKHMIIHTGEKPYSCQVCGKRVSSSTNLAKHMKIHSQEEHY